MRKQNTRLFQAVCLFVVSISLLSSDFYNNQWGIVSPQWFKSHQRDTEAIVIGRLVKSRQDGIFSSGGRVGVGSSGVVPPDFNAWDFDPDYQYKAYAEELTFDSFSTYDSQIGGQGVLFGVLDALIIMPPPQKLTLFYLLTSVLSAMALTLIILWFYQQFGLLVAGVLLVSTVGSPWLVVFGKNLWWCIWAFYLPMIIVMYCLEHEGKTRDFKVASIGAMVFVGVLIKCVVNGYEYITTTLIMMACPFVYYAICSGWGIRKFTVRFLTIIYSSCLAILVSIAMLCGQISLSEGTFWGGIRYIMYALMRRTYGDPKYLPIEYSTHEYIAPLKHSAMSVVSTYVKGTFINLNNRLVFHTNIEWISRYVFCVAYLHLIVLFFSISIYLLTDGRSNYNLTNRKKIVALTWVTWFSALAPLSWYVIFKEHSDVHHHMNYIVWHMPFCIFGFALCGVFLSDLLSKCSSRASKTL